MGSKRRWWWGGGALAVVAVVAVCGGAFFYVDSNAAPTVDPAQLRTVLPLVNSYLASDNGMIGTAQIPGAPQSVARNFCAEHVVEIRSVGTSLQVGLIADCGSFARNGQSLQVGTESQQAVVLTLSPAADPVRVTSAVYEPNDAPPSWYDLHFSAAGSATVQAMLDASAPWPVADPAVQARAAFGLPASAPTADE